MSYIEQLQEIIYNKVKNEGLINFRLMPCNCSKEEAAKNIIEMLNAEEVEDKEIF